MPGEKSGGSWSLFSSPHFVGSCGRIDAKLHHVISMLLLDVPSAVEVASMGSGLILVGSGAAVT